MAYVLFTKYYLFSCNNWFYIQKVLRGTFWEIWRTQIQMYPQTSIEPKYGAFYLNNKVRVQGIVLLVQLS